MKKTKLIVAVLLAVVMVLALGLVACDKHECEHVCPICGKCTDPDCTDPVCADKCPGHEVQHAAPQISVNPTEIEINAGDEIDLMFGVTVTDAEDDNPTLIIFDDDDFDADTEGVYTITYKATNKFGLEATATRTVTVNQALSALALEVRQNLLGEAKWEGETISFKHSLYVELSADTDYDVARSGVFHNTSDGEIVLNVAGGYGCSAILTANGVVIEGRDGANSRLMNEQNPVRSSGVTTMEIDNEEVSVSSAFAQNMVIPAGGYAVVIQSGYAGTTADTDGRGFMNYNVIYAYGNVVRLLWVDEQQVITEYADQAPTISGTDTTVYAAISDASFTLNTEVLTGVTAKDDNGTFEISDDTAVTVTVVDDGGFDINTAGEYTVTISAADAQGNIATATRIVEVTEDVVEVKVNDNSIKMLPTSVAVDQDLTVVGKYLFIIFTPEYEGTINFSNGYGEAFVVDRFGKIVRIYDGVSAKYFDAENPTGIQDASKCTAAGYALEAFNSRQDGEYVVIAPNITGNVSRAFLYSNRTIGGQMALPGITFEAKTYTFTVGEKSFTAAEDKYAFNTAMTAATAPTYSMIVFNKSYPGEVTVNGYGAAVVVNQYGVLVKVYDGAYVGFYDENGKASSVTFNGNNYATVAFSELKEGETLIIFPNDGTNGADSPRTFALGLCTDGSIGKTVTLTDVKFDEKPKDDKTIVIDDTSFTAAEGTWIYNGTVDASTASRYSMIIFDKSYDGQVETNSHGAAIVLDKYGTLVKIYDGANGGFYTVDGKSTDPLTFTTSNYATVAFSELKEGETLIIFPNDGTNGADSPRTFALSLRGVNGAKAYCGEVATLTGFAFEKVSVEIAVGEDTIEFNPEKVAINTTTATAADYDWYVFTTEFSGTLGFANGYGAAIVMDAENKIVRVYNGADGKYYDADNPTGTALASNDYLTTALASLKANEWMLVGVNNGANQAPRDFLRNHHTLGATVTMEEVSVPVADKAMMSVQVNGKIFYTTAIAVNQEVSNVANYDFAVYTYGASGVVVKNGWSEGFVVDSEGKVVRIYDGVNNRYFDAENASGIAGTDKFTIASLSLDAFLSLKQGEMLVIGLNGGLNSNQARSFLVGNRVVGASMSVSGIDVTPAAEAVQYYALTVGTKVWYQNGAQMAVDSAFDGTPAFAIYSYGYTGERYTGAYGVAFVMDSTGKVVRIYDGASGKYYDAENPTGIQDASKCTAAGYAQEAFASLAEGEWVLIAPNGGSTGNVARALLYGNRTVGLEVSYTLVAAE